MSDGPNLCIVVYEIRLPPALYHSINHNCVEKLVETRWVCTEGLSPWAKMIPKLLSYSSHICQTPVITIMRAPTKMNSLQGILCADPVLANRRAGLYSGAYRAFRQRLTKHEPLSRLFCKHCFNDGVGGVSEDKHGSASTMCPQEAHGKGHRYRRLTLHERLCNREACRLTVGNRCCFSPRKHYQTFQWHLVILYFTTFLVA